jgi:hypothetical protein
VVVTTPGGSSSSIASASNTFHVVNEVQATYAPIASAHLGVVKEDPTPPAPPSLSAFASIVGVVVPPAATSISPAVGIIGTSLDLTVSGVGLNGVTSVQRVPSDGVAVGAPVISTDGSSVTVPVTVALSAPQNLRTVRLLAGSANIAFTSQGAALFRVSAPLPEFDSMAPIVLQAGAPAVTLTIVGRNLQNATGVRFDPPAGITVSNLAVNGSGTQATLTISAAAGSATGPRRVILATPAGESSSAPLASNTINVVNTIVGNVTPVASTALGVVLEAPPQPPVPVPVGPFVAPVLGVLVETAAPPAAEDTLRANLLGVAIGPYASGVQVPPLTPTSTGTLVISGVGLADVSAVQIEPTTGIAVGPLTLAPDGTQVAAPLTLTSAAPGLRGVRVLRGSAQVPFIPAGNSTFRIGIGVPSIDSITPILNSRGQTFALLIRGQNFQDALAVRAEPAAGLVIENVVTPNAAGTELTVRISIAADAPLGARVIRVVTPGGASSEVAAPANTFTVLE